MVDLPMKFKYQVQHWELFFSRELESLPDTHIRRECSITFSAQ